MLEAYDRRLRRAEALRGEWPFASEVLDFLSAVLKLQRSVYLRLCENPPEDPEGFEMSDLLPFVPRALDLVESRADPALAEAARNLRGRSEEEWAAYLIFCRSMADSLLDVESDADRVSRLVARIVLQPYLSLLMEDLLPKASADQPGRCPFCRVRPCVALLREDRQAEALRRTLVCSLCAAEWEFPRVLCPACNEESPEKLPRYTAQEIPWIRVEACDSCGRYLKTIDLTLKPDADPVVDELGSTPLDVIARERGYSKLAPNLAGL